MIKKLENHEIKEVMDIWLKTNISAHRFLPEKYWKEKYDEVKEKYLPISTTFIYKDDKIIKGFISIINSFIGALFVLKEYQGEGVGKQLVDHCKYLYPSLELDVYTENITAVKFYKHRGFVVKSERPNEDSGFMQYTMLWQKEK